MDKPKKWYHRLNETNITVGISKNKYILNSNTEPNILV